MRDNNRGFGEYARLFTKSKIWIRRCSGVTQIIDLERSCIALIHQIKDLDKGVKKVHQQKPMH